jgi:DNA-binding MarR family transcriptional regulator
MGSSTIGGDPTYSSVGRNPPESGEQFDGRTSTVTEMNSDTTDTVRAVRAVARLARVLECALAALSPSVSLAHYRVLAALDDGGERASQLARGLALAKPTVTAAVDGLVERGLVVREPVPGDRRSLRISLTAPGRALLAAADAALSSRLADVVAASGVEAGAAVAALAAVAPAPREPARA